MSKNKELNSPQKKIISLREWVKFCLHLKGYALKSFAQRHGITAGTVGVVFSRPFPRMEKLIAETLETLPQDLWPERYDKNGKPNRPNLWYRRKDGLWRPKKRITKNSKVKEKI
jgi:lambda repressor-like predicted transcriptional regulator